MYAVFILLIKKCNFQTRKIGQVSNLKYYRHRDTMMSGLFKMLTINT